MKRIVILINLFCVIQYLSAQTKPMIEIVHNSGIYQIPVEEVDEILVTESDEVPEISLWKFMDTRPEYSLFKEAMQLTNVISRLNMESEDLNFVPAEKYVDLGGGDGAITPQNRYLYYTCFIETNEVFKEAGIYSLKDMQTYARKWFEEMYSDNQNLLNAGLNANWEDSCNYFNRFIAYHFVNKKIDKTDFTYYGIGMSPGYLKFQEYTETLAPGQMLYMAAGRNAVESDDYANTLQLNPSADQIPIEDLDPTLNWSRPARNGVILSASPTLEVSNGLFHEIESVLNFPRTEFKKMRFRFNESSLFPEIMDNAIRAKYTNGQQVYFPNEYLSNIWFRSTDTRLYYLNPYKGASGSWNNYGGDEMFVAGNFDFEVKLPPVPAGQYEVRYGCTLNPNRGCVQFYMGDSRENLKPCGLPRNLTAPPSDYGWTNDLGIIEDNISDLLLRNNGWMKGPNSTNGANGNSTQTLRQIKECIRCIIGVIDLKEDGNIYLRFRNATTNQRASLMMDYFEICPVSIYDNPLKSEPRD